ncbi:MAG: hypothetical protein SOX56_11545 [[Pasteurella] mairii]|nr:hypothetical protein [[Pasteurella] mairii]
MNKDDVQPSANVSLLALQDQLEELQDQVANLSRLALFYNNQLEAHQAVLHALVGLLSQQHQLSHVDVHQRVIRQLDPQNRSPEEQEQLAQALLAIFPTP